MRTLTLEDNNYWDSTTIMDNKVKLNNKLNGHLLYDSAGTNTNFTLNDSKENYKYIEILYGSNGVYSSVKIDKLGASNICLVISRAGYWNDSYYGIKTETARVAISGKNVTFVKGYSNIVRADDNTNLFSDTTEIKIRKVIGYK